MDVSHGDSKIASRQQLVGAAAELGETMSVADERTQDHPTFPPTASLLLDSHGYDGTSSGLDTAPHDHCATDATSEHREADTSEQSIPAAARSNPSSPTIDQPAAQDPINTGDGNAAENEKSDTELFEEYMTYPDTEADDPRQSSHDHQGQEEHTKGGGGVAISTLGGTRRLVRRTSTAGSIGGSGRSGDPYGGATLIYSSPRVPRLQANNDQEEGREVEETEEMKLPPTIASKRALKPFRTPATVRSASFDMAQKHDHEKRSYSSPPRRASRSAPSWKTDNVPITAPPSPSPIKVINERDRQYGTPAAPEYSESTYFAPHKNLPAAVPAAGEARVQLKTTTADGKADEERLGSQRRIQDQETGRTSFPEAPSLEHTHRIDAPPRPFGGQRALDPPPTRHKPEVRFDTRSPSIIASRSDVRSKRTFIPQALPSTSGGHNMPTHPMIEDAPSKPLAPETGKRLQIRNRSLRHTSFPEDHRDIDYLPPRPFGPHVLSPVSERDTEFGSSEGAILHTRGAIRTRTDDEPLRPRASTKRVRGNEQEPLYRVREDSSSMPPPVQEQYRPSSRSTTAGRRELEAQAPRTRSQEAAVMMQISDEEAGQEAPFDPQAPVAKFDFHTELVEKWEEIQQHMSPALQEFAEEVLLNTFEAIFTVAHVFHRLNEDTQNELEEGVRQIEAEEAKHEENKKTIEDFSAEIRRVSAMFRGFGNASRESSVARHR